MFSRGRTVTSSNVQPFPCFTSQIVLSKATFPTTSSHFDHRVKLQAQAQLHGALRVGKLLQD